VVAISIKGSTQTGSKLIWKYYAIPKILARDKEFCGLFCRNITDKEKTMGLEQLRKCLY
jgi:hypothetical protein